MKAGCKGGADPRSTVLSYYVCTGIIMFDFVSSFLLVFVSVSGVRIPYRGLRRKSTAALLVVVLVNPNAEQLYSCSPA